uniref:Probable RNA-binding protein 18 n=3 Tax=Canis lupus familiaris TaxID=9615 RepID=A0A8I3NHC6_CANLF
MPAPAKLRGATGPAPGPTEEAGLARNRPRDGDRSPPRGSVRRQGPRAPRAPPRRAGATHQLSPRALGADPRDRGDGGGAGAMTSRGGAGRGGGADVARHRRPGSGRCGGGGGRVGRAAAPRSRGLRWGMSRGDDAEPTRYHLLKLLQKFGTVKQFDFLFHKSGALEGQPRGYCFVNFETKQEAEQAIQCLNGKLALSKKLVVRWAHAQVKRYDHNKNDKILPISLEPSSSTEPTQSNLSVTAKIKAIEAKLKMMAENPDAEYPAAPVYSYFKPPDKKRTTPYSRTAWKSRR